jgi:hypothetical protein
MVSLPKPGMFLSYNGFDKQERLSTVSVKEKDKYRDDKDISKVIQQENRRNPGNARTKNQEKYEHPQPDPHEDQQRRAR